MKLNVSILSFGKCERFEVCLPRGKYAMGWQVPIHRSPVVSLRLNIIQGAKSQYTRSNASFSVTLSD